MRVQLVSLCQTDAAKAANKPALTPELLAATGARYSRSNDGLDAILAKIDPNRLDASVDSIFKMLDYGHQSIADMVPVAIFLDEISIWLAYHVWSLSSQAGGQESSTRYIKLSSESLINADTLGIQKELRDEWSDDMSKAFEYYQRLESAWSALADSNPRLMRLPKRLLEDKSEKSIKAITRMRRNFAFDRARYLLPSAARTNVMLTMSARAWAGLCQHLCSDTLPEANALGEAIREEMKFGAPRLLKHSTATDDIRSGIAAAMTERQLTAALGLPKALANGSSAPAEDTAHIAVMAPFGVTGADLANALKFHSNRYAWQGDDLHRTAVRFSWDAVTLAEIRDLNRHRTGSKYSSLIPQGFYGAQEQVPLCTDGVTEKNIADTVSDAAAFGREMSRKAHQLLSAGNPQYVYWTLLGTQFDFEHVTTADKFVYEAELRTGTGSHYRYAKHLHDALEKWFELFPETRGLVLEGTAEPE